MLKIFKIYGQNSIKVSSIESWNEGQNHLKNFPLRLLSPKEIKLLISNEYFKND